MGLGLLFKMTATANNRCIKTATIIATSTCFFSPKPHHPKKKKPNYPVKATRLSLHSAIPELLRSVAFRPYLSIGLAFLVFCIGEDNMQKSCMISIVHNININCYYQLVNLSATVY
jgi:hypothetical protein